MADTQTNWIDLYVSLVPAAQTVVWAAIVAAALYMLRKPILELANLLKQRIAQGDRLVTPWLSLERQKEFEKLEEVLPSGSAASDDDGGAVVEEASAKESASVSTTESVSLPSTKKEWATVRNGMYQSRRGLYLSHFLTPSRHRGQKYDISILVRRHVSSRSGRFGRADISDVAKAEFFLGQAWGNHIFEETPREGLLGLRTAAYGPFLCVCKVTFTGGEEVLLDRYIDFEMGPLENVNV